MWTMGHELFLTQFEAGESISAIPRRIRGHLLWVNRIFATTVIYYRKAGTITGYTVIPPLPLRLGAVLCESDREFVNHVVNTTLLSLTATNNYAHACGARP